MPIITYTKAREISQLVDSTNRSLGSLRKTKTQEGDKIAKFRVLIRLACTLAIGGSGYLTYSTYNVILQRHLLLTETRHGAYYYAITLVVSGIVLAIWFSWVPMNAKNTISQKSEEVLTQMSAHDQKENPNLSSVSVDINMTTLCSSPPEDGTLRGESISDPLGSQQNGGNSTNSERGGIGSSNNNDTEETFYVQ